MSKPRLAITMGDAAGIGPEVALKALAKTFAGGQFDCLLIGSFSIWAQAAEMVKFERQLVRLEQRLPDSIGDKIGVLDVTALSDQDFKPGAPNPATGLAAGQAIEIATQLALERQVDAIVTAPIQKEALNAAGYKFPGHTEMLQNLSGAQDVVMLMYSKKLSTALVSTHLPLSQTVNQITGKKILRVITLAYDFLKRLNYATIRIAIAAYNPHAGESGLFGREEIQIIAPAIRQAQKMGFPVTGPFPPDTVFAAAFQGQFDLVVAMYHDQGLIPFKLVAFDEGVNVTPGLPFWRTSPDHGTALDIAGKNMANDQSMQQAILLAARLAQDLKNRK